MKKNLIAITGVIIMSIFMFVGCGNEETTSETVAATQAQEPVSEYSIDDYEDAMESLCAECDIELYDMSYNESTKELDVAIVVNGSAAAALINGSDWVDIVSSCEGLCDNLQECATDVYSIPVDTMLLNVQNDANTDNVLLCIVNGTILYDCANE